MYEPKLLMFGAMKNQVEEPSRKEIWKMFDQISPTYDRVNRVMTMGLDQLWRKKVCTFFPKENHLRILDCATGTGDQIIAMMETDPRVDSAVGIDLAEAMIAIGNEKLAKKAYANKVTLQVASALEIPFPDHSFDAVTISFGIRNVTDVIGSLKEFHRVLKVGGRVLILEGTMPEKKTWKNLNRFYLRHILPRIGGWISKKPDAYRYLNETIETFPQGGAFCQLMQSAGFKEVKLHPLFFGVATVYQGDRHAVD